jgi:hypothetical protein
MLDLDLDSVESEELETDCDCRFPLMLIEEDVSFRDSLCKTVSVELLFEVESVWDGEFSERDVEFLLNSGEKDSVSFEKDSEKEEDFLVFDFEEENEVENVSLLLKEGEEEGEFVLLFVSAAVTENEEETKDDLDRVAESCEIDIVTEEDFVSGPA